MNRAISLFQKLLNRPYYLWKYTLQIILVVMNYLALSLQNRIQTNFKIGRNPRVLSINAFKAEMPNASIKIGDSIIVYHNCDILATGPGQLEIGDGCIIGSNFRLYCREKITIGSHVLISWGVFIADYDAHSINPAERLNEVLYINHSFFPSFDREEVPKDIANFVPSYVTRPIYIGDNVWIGANAIILKGVSIGSGSVVAAGAVITSDVPPCSIAAGNPARIIKHISQ